MTKQDLFHIYKAGLTFKNQLMNISKKNQEKRGEIEKYSENSINQFP